MDVLSYSEARARLAEVIDGVVENRTPVVVTRGHDEAVVIVSLADWDAMEETDHLLSSPTDAARLREAIRELSGTSL